MIAALRWRLHSLADWFQDRACWRAANAVDRIALAIYRIERMLKL